MYRAQKKILHKFKFTMLLYIFISSNLFAGSLENLGIATAYDNAVLDASVAELGEIVNNLIAITPQNDELVWNKDKSKLLVVSWKSQDSYEQFLKPYHQTSTNEAYVIWVTTAPQVQNFSKQYLKANPDATEDDINLRLKQYLGLNFEWEYDLFVEMWVSPDDLFRPSVDPEIDDSTCNLNFGDTAPVVKGIQDYPSFYKNLYFSDFRSLPGVPWTGLGYTFDWGNPVTEEGASEFILVPGAAYEIEQAVPTMEYCKMTN